MKDIVKQWIRDSLISRYTETMQNGFTRSNSLTHFWMLSMYTKLLFYFLVNVQTHDTCFLFFYRDLMNGFEIRLPTRLSRPYKRKALWDLSINLTLLSSLNHRNSRTSIY